MQSKKIIELEALRGIASIIVLLWHFQLGFFPKLSGFFESGKGLIGTPLFFIINGSAAVIIFFILSGFVLTYKFYVTQDSNYLNKGVEKRYFRLVVPVICSILLSYILFKTHLYFYKQAGDLSGSPWLVDFAYAGRGNNFIPNIYDALRTGLFLVFLKPANAYYNTVLWTMVYEWWGSISVFLLAALFSKSSKKSLLGILLILFLFTYFTSVYYFCFIIGTLLALLYSKMNKIQINIYLKIIIGFIGLLCLSYYQPVRFYSFLAVIDHYFATDSVRIIINMIGGTLLILVLLAQHKEKKHYINTIAIFLGRISFPLYLIHGLVICSFSSFVYIHLMQTGLENLLCFLYTFLASLPLIALLTFLLMKIDENWIKLVNRVIKKRPQNIS